MAYLHCHNCDWQQDDFWEWRWNLKSSRPFGYNPLSLIIEDWFEHWRPSYTKYDEWWAKENGFKSATIHSWRLLWFEWWRHLKRVFTQTWWTSKSWDKARRTAKCPGCGSGSHFDID